VQLWLCLVGDEKGILKFAQNILIFPITNIIGSLFLMVKKRMQLKKPFLEKQWFFKWCEDDGCNRDRFTKIRSKKELAKEKVNYRMRDAGLAASVIGANHSR